ncbi:MAG: M15 family metallopeptidase [Candidatus Marinimicrobia bacterium]|nr:M15 family metallopeptidase [Candidatus Neomarinimicrobiota bacterium]
MEEKNKFLPYIISTGIAFVVLGGVLVYVFMQVSVLKKQAQISATESAELTDLAVGLLREVNYLSKNIEDLRSQTTGLSYTLSSTQKNIDDVKTQVGGVEETVGSISGTVGNLQKLSQIDEELLKKYSKFYFLNENYTPSHLIDIPFDYTYSDSVPEQFLTEAWPFLRDLFDSAKSEGVLLYAKSAYRSFGEQQSLKSLYSVVYGPGTANSFSADQGYSEHQLGVTLDFITVGLNGQLDDFGDTEAYQWLLDNAYKFGFQLSYPDGNEYYVFEPWHWRFVGVKLATYLHDNHLNFYNLDQRDIDTYLVDIFD